MVDRHEKLLSSYEGKTPIGETFLINEQKSDINIDVDNFANGKAETLGFDISDHWISSMQIITTYADGVTTEGYAIYALIRNGLPVETTPYFSKRSIQERRISGEYMRVDWTESGIVSFTIRMLTIENKEESSGTLLSQTEAEALVQDQVEQLSSLLGCGVEVSLCYIVVPERGGMTYYALVPAWRFSFQGKGIEDANAVCVHAYTGEVIR